MHEGAHDVHTHGDGARGVQDIGRLNDAVLSEGEGTVAAATPTSDRKLRSQVIEFLSGELEHEILREALGVALDSLVEPPGGDAINRGQFAIEYDALVTSNEHGAGNALDRRRGLGLRLRRVPTGLGEDGIEHLHDEALPRLRQLLDALDLLLESGGWATLGRCRAVLADQILDRDGEDSSDLRQQGYG